MKPNQPKHQHYCHACNNTGLCQNCEGRGCMECNYSGMCRHCQDVSYQEAEKADIQHVAKARNP